MLNIPSRNTGKKNSETMECKCFFQKIYLMNYLHHFLSYLLGDFLLSSNIKARNIAKIIRTK
jgi:hypothetical protein